MGRFLLVLLALLLGLGSIVGRDLSSRDETRVAGIAREMATSGNLALPRLNGKPFLEYPPLGYLPVAFLLRKPGPWDDLLARLPSVLFGLATVWLTCRIGTLLGGGRLGLAAGFLLLTTAGFLNVQRRCLVDASLVFSVTLSLYGFLGWYLGKGVLAYELFWLGMGLGFLCKGLLGLGIPAATALLYLGLRRDGKGLKRLLLGWGPVLFALPVGIWLWGLDRSGGAGLLEEAFDQSLRRFFSASAEHGQPFYFYLLVLPYFLAPWILIPAFLALLRFGPSRWKEAFRLTEKEELPLLWFSLVFLALSLAASKRNLYLAPLAPAFALLCASWWDRLRERFGIGVGAEVLGLGTAAVLIGALAIRVEFPEERGESFRPMFEEIVRTARAEELRLYDPPEALAGAAVFYLGRTIPAFSSARELSQWASSNPSPSPLLLHERKADEVREALGQGRLRPLSSWKVGRHGYELHSLSAAGGK